LFRGVVMQRQAAIGLFFVERVALARVEQEAAAAQCLGAGVVDGAAQIAVGELRAPGQGIPRLVFEADDVLVLEVRLDALGRHGLRIRRLAAFQIRGDGIRVARAAVPQVGDRDVGYAGRRTGDRVDTGIGEVLEGI